MVYGNHSSPSSTVVSCASESLIAYQNANSQQYVVAIANNSRDLCWQALMDGFVEVNWDTVVNNNRRIMGIDIIIRRNKGRC